VRRHQYICRIGERNISLPITEEEVAELKALEKEGDGLARSKQKR
jgi:hypothetical protein